MITSKEIVNKIKNTSKIALFSHHNPDPDACGSLFAMRDICVKLGAKADVFLKSTNENYLNYIFPIDQAKHNFKSEEYDLVILVDSHAINRAEDQFQKELEKVENILVIDHHHISEEEGFKIKEFLIKPEYASTTQILVEIIQNENIEINEKTAKYLYAGLMGDTDRFLHSNLTKEVFNTATFLLEKGADVQNVYNFMYRYKTKEQIAVNKLIFRNMKYTLNDKCSYIVVTQKDLQKIGADIEDVKFFSNDLVNIKGVELSFLAIEYSKNYYKLSIRALGDLNTLILSNKMGGGGHILASGFSIDATKRDLFKLIPSWAEVIYNGSKV